MAEQVNQKVFVSPGVYTSESEIPFISQSVGVATLGLTGESLKGPAFEPIFVTNYDEFQTFFGGTSPEKFVNTQIPKYEGAYIAKSYLQQSNQMFFTRVLGLSGYDAGPSWSIRVVANIDGSTIVSGSSTSFTTTFIGSTGTTLLLSGSSSIVNANLDKTYTKADLSTSTIRDDIKELMDAIFLADIGTAQDLISHSLGVYGSIPSSELASLASLNYTAITNNFGVEVDLGLNDLESSNNDPWYYANFINTSGENYSGYSFYYTILQYIDLGSSYSGTVVGNVYTFTGTAYSDYHNMVVATLRSRGITEYSSTNHGPVYQVANTSDVQLLSTGSYSGILSSPFANFAISGITRENKTFSIDASLNTSASNFIGKVFGTDNFGKDRTVIPLFVEEVYPSLLTYAYNKGYIRGLKTDLVSLGSARSGSAASIGKYLDRYKSPTTPYLVSELRGNKVYNLFKFVSISDGNSANTEIKVSIGNISLKNRTFDVFVRNFFDTDANPVVIEKYTNCNLDENSNNFIAKKIGSSNGEFSLISRYVMVEMSDEFPSDAVPCGFMGYVQKEYEQSINVFGNPAIPVYKTKYYIPNEEVFSIPFGVGSNNVSGDNVKRTYLGFSNTTGVDVSLLQYKGMKNIGNLYDVTSDWNYMTKGFHMDSGATTVTIANSFVTSGTSAFECGVGDFTQEPTSQTNPYYFLYSRKFTVCFAGGFDGWDIYSEKRTNTDEYRVGGSGFLAGASPASSTRYPTASGQGLFKEITVGDNTIDYANTDYYAYLLGIKTFENPESVNINIFATPGIDYVNNSNLVEATIDMIESDRADSIYITTTPDINLTLPTSDSIIYTQEAIDSLEETNIDSSYTATYYPWILVRDSVNNTQIYIPPTAEVCRNLALTDNISFPWFASAGYTRGLVNSVKARLKLTQENRDTLYQGRINPIATFSDVGTVIWGNKTLQVRDSALNSLNVRRLLLQARKLISAVAVRLLFEQNDQIVRQQFLDTVNPILDGIRRDRGLYDFRVVVSNAPEDLDRNTMNATIYLKPTKALEYILINFTITPTGASFEDI
jgi:hypothetical protein